MEVRAKSKELKKLKKVKTVLDLTFTADETVGVPIVMFKDDKGALREYIRGFKPIYTFLKYGYNRIIKKCPLRHRKCIGEKCQFYVIENGTGDCAITWNAIMSISQIKGIK